MKSARLYHFLSIEIRVLGYFLCSLLREVGLLPLFGDEEARSDWFRSTQQVNVKTTNRTQIFHISRILLQKSMLVREKSR